VDRFLVALLAAKVTRLTHQMVELAEMPAAARVYRRIVDLGDLFNATTPGTAIPVTQDQLASLAGVKLRITNRVISDAKRDGLIEAGRRRLAVLNLPELRKRAQLDGRAFP
jgi:CRP/FNR family transcriptional regulator, cyclic AMP receptor protein